VSFLLAVIASVRRAGAPNPCPDYSPLGAINSTFQLKDLATTTPALTQTFHLCNEII
jgi:hypothetical protein